MDNKDNTFMTGAEVAHVLGVSIATGYRIIQRLNKEMVEKGFIVIRGKVSRKYFSERFYDSQAVG